MNIVHMRVFFEFFSRGFGDCSGFCPVLVKHTLYRVLVQLRFDKLRPALKPNDLVHFFKHFVKHICIPFSHILNPNLCRRASAPRRALQSRGRPRRPGVQKVTQSVFISVEFHGKTWLFMWYVLPIDSLQTQAHILTKLFCRFQLFRGGKACPDTLPVIYCA